MADERLTPAERLTRSSDIDAVFSLKRSAADRLLIVYGRPNELGFNRLAVVIGKRSGNSVQRHRFKRVVREAFRRSKEMQPQGWDWVVLPRLPRKKGKAPPPTEPVEWSAPALRSELIDLMARLARRPRRDPQIDTSHGPQEQGDVRSS